MVHSASAGETAGGWGLKHMALLRSLVTGYVLLFFSERLFWTVFRPGDSVGDYVITWLAYSVAAYLLLCIISVFRVAHAAAMMVAGAMYGWLVEGGIAATLYGTEESAPFPLSLLCTGVSWHALISVMAGCYLIPRLLRRRSPWPALAAAVGIGLFWGLWATFLWAETPPQVTPLRAFVAHGALITALLAACYWLWARLEARAFRVTWPGMAVATLLLGFFYVQHAAALGARVLLLPALLVDAGLVLWRYRIAGAPAAVTPLPPSPWVARNCLALLAAPLVATGVYALLLRSGMDGSPIRDTLWWAMIGVGATAFAGSILVILAGRRTTDGPPTDS